MVRLVGSCKSRKLVVLRPVEAAAVDYDSADTRRVAVIYFVVEWVTISAPNSNGRPVYRGRESVVDYQRHAVGMSRARILFNIEHDERGIRYSLGEHGFCVIFECRVELPPPSASGRTKVKSMPSFLIVTLKRLKVPPYIADAATTWSPAEQI